MKSNQIAYFTPNTKMAELIATNYRLLTVLTRFNIHLGFGERSVAQICKANNINERVFLLVCNMYSFTDYDFSLLLSVEDIDSLLCFLIKSHRYYINERLHEIQRLLSDSLDSYLLPNHQILLKFFTEYQNEVIKHFEHEEHTVFPYLQKLVNHTVVSNRRIKTNRGHESIKAKISDLKNILLKYFPDNNLNLLYNDILTNIFIYEEDLHNHTQMEDKILLPFIKKLEEDNEK